MEAFHFFNLNNQKLGKKIKIPNGFFHHSVILTSIVDVYLPAFTRLYVNEKTPVMLYMATYTVP